MENISMNTLPIFEDNGSYITYTNNGFKFVRINFDLGDKGNRVLIFSMSDEMKPFRILENGTDFWDNEMVIAYADKFVRMAFMA
jgi:hypothetical protein